MTTLSTNTPNNFFDYFVTSVRISLPLDYDEPQSDNLRYEMRRWCKTHCSHRFAAKWVPSRDAATFDFESPQDAAQFALQWGQG